MEKYEETIHKIVNLRVQPCVNLFGRVLALKRAGLVSTFRTENSTHEEEQSILSETSRPDRLYSEPPLLQKRFLLMVVTASLLFICILIVTLIFHTMHVKLLTSHHSRNMFYHIPVLGYNFIMIFLFLQNRFVV